MARSRKKPFVLALVVSLGCARTGLELVREHPLRWERADVVVRAGHVDGDVL
jgi:hypothetical protein